MVGPLDRARQATHKYGNLGAATTDALTVFCPADDKGDFMRFCGL